MSVISPESSRTHARSWTSRFAAAGVSSEVIREIFSTAVLLRWADQQEAEQEAAAIFEDRTFSPILPDGLRWRRWHASVPEQMGQILVRELGSILFVRGTYENPLGTYLQALIEPSGRIRQADPDIVGEIVAWLSKQPFETTADRKQLLSFYDALVLESVKGNEGRIRESLILPAIAQLLIAIADPRPGERVYDPCFGTAGFLTASWDHAKQSQELQQSRRGEPILDVFGFEINPSAYLVGLTRLILTGVDQPHLERGNSLERDPPPNPNREGFDVVFANPPFGFGPGNKASYQFPFPARDTVGLFVQHVLFQLRPQGLYPRDFYLGADSARDYAAGSWRTATWTPL